MIVCDDMVFQCNVDLYMTLSVDFQMITVSLFRIQTGIRSALLCACAEVGVAALPSLYYFPPRVEPDPSGEVGNVLW